MGCWQRRLPSPGASVCVTHLAVESRVDSLRPFSPGLRASAPEADAPNRRFWWFVGLIGAAVGAFYFAPVVRQNLIAPRATRPQPLSRTGYSESWSPGSSRLFGY